MDASINSPQIKYLPYFYSSSDKVSSTSLIDSLFLLGIKLDEIFLGSSDIPVIPPVYYLFYFSNFSLSS